MSTGDVDVIFTALNSFSNLICHFKIRTKEGILLGYKPEHHIEEQ